jgi:hyaluronan synthase
MTAHVLGTGPKKTPSENNVGVDNKFQTDHIDYVEIKKALEEDRQSKSKGKYWKVLFSHSIRVNIGVPETFSSLVKQQIRWRKSFIRSLGKSGTFGVYWKRPLYAAMLYYIQTLMKFVRPVILLHVLVFLPLSGEILSPLLWLSGIMFTGMIYGVDYRLRHPGDKMWLYRPLFTLMTTFVYTWLLIWAGLTIKKQAWR